MNEIDRFYLIALGGGGLMNIIVGLVTQFYGPTAYAAPINYILGGFLLGMLAMGLARGKRDRVSPTADSSR